MIEIRIITAQRAVSAAGTPEKIKEAPEWQKAKVISVRIRAKTGNAGAIYITNETDKALASTVGDILAPGEVYLLDVHDILDAYLNLSKIYIDAATTGDGISLTAIEVM